MKIRTIKFDGGTLHIEDEADIWLECDCNNSDEYYVDIINPEIVECDKCGRKFKVELNVIEIEQEK